MAKKLGPGKDVAAIAQKQAHVDEQILMLRRNQRIVRRVGGIETVDLGGEVAFQEARATVLQWCADHSAAEIEARRLALHEALGPDGVAAKGGTMLGLPPEVVTMLAEAELLDLALGDL